ncbi:MAG: Mov34/MPN/PAD-1 family protein [Anaerolineae bacterium]
MKKRLEVPELVINQANQHLLSVWPEEGCGFLVGKNNTVFEFHSAENEKHSRVAYRMNPADQIKIIIDAEDRQLDILAIIHSHPDGPAQPSLTDIREATWHDMCYVIVSLQSKKMPHWQGWLLNSEKYEEIPLFIKEANGNGQPINLRRVI